MNIMRFRVYVDDTQGHGQPVNPLAYDLAIYPADRMRAERASTKELPPSQRGPGAIKANSETWVLLWLWCAATRLGVTTQPFSTWADLVLDYDRLNDDGTVKTEDDDDDDATEDPELGPTRPGVPTSGL